MCHQSVGLIARHIEAAGFATIGLSSARSITASANPPRSVVLDVPLGHTSGPADDTEMQRHVVHQALELGAAMTTPGEIAELDLRWRHDEWKDAPLSWSRRREDDPNPSAPSGDTRTEREAAPQYQTDADRVAADQRTVEDHCRSCIGLDL